MPDHSPLPWRLSAQRGREVLDADGETVLTVWPACGSPARALADADLVLAAVNGHGSLVLAVRAALALLEQERRSPADVEQARRLLRRALEGESAQVNQPT